MDCKIFQEWGDLLSQPPLDVELLEFVETGEDTSTSNTSENVSASTLHHGHEALVLHDLNEAVDWTLVFDSLEEEHLS